MCCFSGNVKFVRGTCIFTRMTEPGRQCIVYQMEMAADAEVAMILPLPVAAGSGDQALSFIDLSKYPNFFKDLATGFPRPMPRASFSGGPAVASAPLEVKQVGAFEASFVPTVKDFERLDTRFRLPTDVWQSLPQYADHGFAVFKLRAGEHRVHPMAFTFPTRHADRLFFPTVHIHDGKVHEEEDFDHYLYCQVGSPGLFATLHWEESPTLASSFAKVALAQKLIDPTGHVYRKSLTGKMKNEDIILSAA